MTTDPSRQKRKPNPAPKRTAALTAKRIIAGALAVTLPLSNLSADVGSSMDSFLNDVGGAANVTGPTAFEGLSPVSTNGTDLRL